MKKTVCIEKNASVEKKRRVNSNFCKFIILRRKAKARVKCVPGMVKVRAKSLKILQVQYYVVAKGITQLKNGVIIYVFIA